VRLVARDGRAVHLGYGYNVLPGESVDALCAQVARVCGPVRARLGVARMGVGLWIARAAATELRAAAAVARLRAALDAAGLYVFTLNGFPYGGFHEPVVKARVYEPGWDDDARVAYTIELAEVLAALLPDELDRGSISTVPLGPATVDRDRARAGLQRAGEALAELATRTGRTIELGLEPEPGAGFERVAEAAAWLCGLSRSVGVCVDACHTAVVDEAPGGAFAALAAAGVRCSKVQVSSALVVPRPDRDAEALRAFDEPRYLHQVRSARGGAMDLPEALATLDRGAPWRVHFHVPVFAAALDGGLATRQAQIAPVLAAALAAPPGETGPPPHLELETYTWGVLPAASRPRDDAALIDGIAHELRWTLDLLSTLGVTPP
jgi:sugar phosphate isomerase/epimerase